MCFLPDFYNRFIVREVYVFKANLQYIIIRNTSNK